MIKEQALYIEEHLENLKPYDLGVTPWGLNRGTRQPLSISAL